MQKIGKVSITKGELIKFYGIIVLRTRYKFRRRRELWSTKLMSKFTEAPKFGEKTGMSRNRFDNIWSCIWFSDQPEQRPEGMGSMEYRWRLVDDFIDDLNDYRASN